MECEIIMDLLAPLSVYCFSHSDLVVSRSTCGVRGPRFEPTVDCYCDMQPWARAVPCSHA